MITLLEGFMTPFGIMAIIILSFFVIKKLRQKKHKIINQPLNGEKEYEGSSNHNHHGPSKGTMWTAHITTVIVLIILGYIVIRISGCILNSGPSIEKFFGQ